MEEDEDKEWDAMEKNTGSLFKMNKVTFSGT